MVEGGKRLHARLRGRGRPGGRQVDMANYIHSMLLYTYIVLCCTLIGHVI